MGRVLTIMAFVVAIGLSLAMFIPPLLDGSHLRGRIEAEGAALLGAPVETDGAIRVRLLPRPLVTVEGVRAVLPADRTGLGTDIEATAQAVTVELDWRVLIGGGARPIGLVIDRAGMTGAAPDWSAAFRTLPAGTAAPFSVTFSDSRFEDTVRGMTIDALDAAWAMARDGETLSLSAKIGNVPVTVSGALRGTDNRTAYDRAGPRNVRLRLASDGAGASLRFVGTLPAGSAIPSEGTWTGEIMSLAGLQATLAGSAGTPVSSATPGLLTRSVSLSATSRGEETGLRIENLEVSAGGSRFEGRGRALFRTGSDASAPPRLSFDLKTPTLVVEQAVGPLPSVASVETIARFLAPLDAGPAWQAFDIDLTLTIQSLLWQESVIQGAVLGAALSDGRWRVTRAEGGMPGGATVRIAGMPPADPETPDLWTGEVSITANHSRSFLSWAGVPVERIRPGILGSLDARSLVTATPGRLGWNEARLTLGSGTIETTGFVHHTDDRRQASIEARLGGVDLDGYAGLLTEIVPSDLMTTERRQGGTAASAPEMPSWSASLSLTGENVRLGGQIVRLGTLKGGLEANGTGAVLTISDLALEDRRATVVKAEGRVAWPWESGPALFAADGAVRLHVVAASPQAFLASIGRNGLLATDDRTAQPVEIDLTADLGDGRLNGRLDGSLGSATLDGAMDLRHDGEAAGSLPTGGEVTMTVNAPDADVLAVLLGLAEAQASAPDGEPAPGHFHGRLLLGEGTGTAEAALSLPGLSATTTADIQVTADDLAYDGRLALTATDGMPAGTDVTFDSALAGSLDGFTLSGLAARIGETALAGDLAVTGLRPDRRPPDGAGVMAGAEPAGRLLSGALTIDRVTLDAWTDRLFAAPSADDPSEATSWSVAPLDLSWLAWGRAELDIAVTALAAGPVSLREITVPLRLEDGRLTADVAGTTPTGEGAVDLAVSLRRDTIGRAVADLAIDARSVPIALSAPEGEDPVPATALTGTVAVRGELTSAGRSLFDLIANLSGELDLDATDTRIAPLDLASFAAAWPSIETLSQFEGAVAQTATTGAAVIDRLTGSVLLRDGVARAEGVTGTVGERSVALAGSVNLAARLVDLDAAFHVAADASPLTLRVSGPFDGVRKSLDASDLRYDAAVRIKETKAGRLTEDDLPPDVLELLRILEEDQAAEVPDPE